MDISSKDYSNVLLALETLTNAYNYDKTVTQGLSDTILAHTTHKNMFVRVKALIL